MGVIAFYEFLTQTAFLNREVSMDQRGAVAQLGARVNGIHEVAGSIPASSTNLPVY